MLKYLVIVSVVAAGAASHAQTKRLDVGSGIGLEEPSVLSKALQRYQQTDPAMFVADRLRFNSFLSNPARPYITKARLTKEQLEAMRNATEKRNESMAIALADVTPTWHELSSEDQASTLAKLVDKDEELVTNLVEVLSEVLTPTEQSILSSAFMTALDEKACCDPIVRRWMGLTRLQAERFVQREDNAAKYLLDQWNTLQLPIMSPLPAKEEETYRRTKALKWEGIDAKTVKRILVHCGMLLEDEGLSEYVNRIAPKDGEALVKYVPAFSDSVKQTADNK